VVEQRHLPDADRLSVFSAVILLAYAVARFVNFPTNEFGVQLPGLYVDFVIHMRLVVAFLVTGMAAAGADWLLRQHPRLGQRLAIEHWILPAVTAWVIGVPIYQLPLGLQWWSWFLVGGALLVLVVVAEYITIDPQDLRYPAATAGLTAVAFALFLILSISLRDVGERLFWVAPALALAGGAIGLRTLHLRLGGTWAFFQAGVIVLLLGQFTAALYYLPLSPLAFGLILLGVAYGLTGLLANLATGRRLTQAVVEPLVILMVVVALALWMN